MDFSLRDFCPADFEAVWSIDQQCFARGISYSRSELATYLRRPGAFALVAEADESRVADQDRDRLHEARPTPILGFIVAEAGSRGSGHVITIDVVPSARGLGIGSRLIRAAEDRLRAANCPTVVLETAVNNRVALSFYRAHDYHIVKTIPRYYSDGLDALVLRKDLLSQCEPAKLPK